VNSYMLEKSRVTIQNQGERNFHIFYLLCMKANEFPELGLTSDFSHWNYLSGSEVAGRRQEQSADYRDSSARHQRGKDLERIQHRASHPSPREPQYYPNRRRSQLRYNQSLASAGSLLQVSTEALCESLGLKKLRTVLKILTRAQALENTESLSKGLSTPSCLTS
jgi:myosin heavy subunit